ncbi:MAG: trypsin-like peptidase domain-containing protein [Bacteroidota bacterium]
MIGLVCYHNFIALPRVIESQRRADYSPVGYHDRLQNYREALFRSAIPTDFIKAAAKSKPSVVYVNSYQKVSGSLFTEGYEREKGSGIIISSDGDIITNYHVVKDADYIEVTLGDKREFVAEVVGIDEVSDIALLHIEASSLPYLLFADSDSLQVGEWILAVGNPFGLQSTVTAGIVSAKARDIDILDKNDVSSYIQTDAVINPGSSGGAIVNTNGQLMGISSAILSSTGNYQGLSFAIPSNVARKVVVDIKEFGAVQRARIGIAIAEVNADIAKKLRLKEIKGIHINSVNLNSAAAEAGIKRNDVIISIQDYPVSGNSEFYEQLNKYRPGDRITIKYIRQGREALTTLVLRNHLNTTDFVSVRNDKILRDLGIEIRDLNSIEKKRMNISGVMIISVSKGSTIYKTNMEPGFIVESFNDITIENSQEFISLIKNTEGDVVLKGFYERYPGEFPYSFEL